MTPHNSHQPRSNRSLGVWLGYWLGLFIITHLPLVSGGHFHFRYADKIVHFVLYFFLAYLGGRYLFAIGRARSTISLIGYAGMYAAYGAFDEWSQQYTGRTMSFTDWLADAGGIVLATVWLVRQRRPSTVPDPNRHVG
jgi:hypothetical protein